MKPLYLNGRSGMRVTLDEPALRVSLPERAVTLYPLQRISRVIASGTVEWSTAALLACAERGITITFLRSDGAIQGYLFGESTHGRVCTVVCRICWTGPTGGSATPTGGGRWRVAPGGRWPGGWGWT